jgi:GT2 family glycosyltransferase
MGPADTLPEHAAGVAASRAALLREIGDGHDLTLVTGPGNLGDELIRAGTRALLQGRIYRDVWIDDLARASGDTVLLPGGGAWCRPHDEWMLRALAVAELRFERVIVLPSSFDVTEDAVRAALEGTDATVFAREHESLRHIEGLCRAHLAHDCGFFYDFSGRTAAGIGTLNAFRDEEDGLETADGLDSWLASIERHADIRTDRVPVMIAAALMGKTVEIVLPPHGDLFAVAESWLEGFPITATERPRRSTPRLDPPRGGANGTARVTAVILTRDKPDTLAGAVRSVLSANVPARVLVIANNPAPEIRSDLAALAAEDPRIALRVTERNLGTAGGRQLAVELVTTEFVLFLDDDAELIDGALERLLAGLEHHPEAVGVSALVVSPDGSAQHCGGSLEWSDHSARFVLGGADLALDDPRVPETGVSDWLPGTAALIRAAALREFPIDPGFRAYYEDNDWSFRVERERPGSFRRCREAIVVHHGGRAPEYSCALVRVFCIVELLAAHARFLRRHGVLLDVDLHARIPELRLADGGVDLTAARLLVELVAARGVAWVATEWLSGGLDPLFGAPERIEELRGELAARDAELREARRELSVHVELRECEAELGRKLAWLLERHETLLRVENGGWWRLRTQLEPLLSRATVIRRALAARRSRWS